MKKIIKILSLTIILVISYLIYTNYPKLDIVTGYSAKSVASNMFLSKRTLQSVEKIDNNFSLIKDATNTVDTINKTVSSELYGLKKNTAIYREGLGAVVINDKYNENEKVIIPNRTIKNNPSFPFFDNDSSSFSFENIDYNTLNNFIDSYFDEKKAEKTYSILAIYKNKIIAEKYAKPFNKKSIFLGWSMTKSIVGTMYGVMQKKGIIDINSKVNLDEWKNDDRKNITYNNLLQMNSGLEWTEDYNKVCDVTKMLYLDYDMSKRQINKKLVGKPNNSWYYSSGTTNLLAGILMKKYFSSQQEYLDFWYNELIDKIGMNSMLIETDLAGNFVGSSYAWANTRDWAKLGLLYLNKGNWNGEQIIDSTWVEYATTATNTSNGEYGAQIYLNKGKILSDVPEDTYFFDGYQGQRVFIIPSKDLVVVRLGIDNTTKTDFNHLLNGIIKTIK